MSKRIVALSVLLLSAGFSLPVHAQTAYNNASLRNALVEYLYQYGKEIFYRGVDPQEASFVFQRALVLDCHHQGAQAFLNKLHSKYPDVSVRVWGCGEEPLAEGKNSLRTARASLTEKLPDEEAKARVLRREVAKAEDQMAAETEDKDLAAAPVIAPKAKIDENENLSYSNIANDQKDLIRIQQSNIDYLKSELAETKKQLQNGTASPDAYKKTQMELADSGLDAEEHKMAANAKDVETQDLRQRLNDLQEQLALVQKIVDDKNRTIESLQKELKPADSAGQ